MSNSPLAAPVKVMATIKRVTTNGETGERTILLSLPQSDAGRVAQLSVYDDIVFEVSFKAAEKAGTS